MVGGGRKQVMGYEIYLDSLFLQETIINFYVLLICRNCIFCRGRYRRLIMAAGFAGVFQTSLFMVPMPDNKILFYVLLWGLYTVAAVITILLAFGKMPAKVYIKHICSYMIILLSMGGIFMGILPRLPVYKNSDRKIIFFLIAGMFVYIFLWYVFKEKRQKHFCGKLKLVHEEKSLAGNYFMDSGNGLVESLSGKPVLLAKASWLFATFEKEELFSRPVIYKSVGKRKGILYAYGLDKLVISGEKREYTYEKVWVGICAEDIFSGKDYQIILPPLYGVRDE